ncbi:cbb3-type cytochrome c oxidase subunit I [Limnohabitans sp.]|uniref:cbb3-type cytochrome c oxidase subunit I n=1 Tax=Limnohabitans sp. TaxID=1907725 RepID=UPI00286F7888|nr:cbb3-type cytochrome c oxidase subunit I [Limnohabitans sp.]
MTTLLTSIESKDTSFGVKLYLGTSMVVVLLMMVVGLLMRAAQAGWIDIPADIFYQLMTTHGAGMVGISGLAGASIMWHFLSRHVHLSRTVLYINYGLFLSGVVLILGSIFWGGYAGGWTFLWPLPAKSMGLWSADAAASFISGLLLIGVGFLIFNLDAGLAITRRYGSVLRGLGLDQLLSGEIRSDHPPTVVASSMVIIVNTLGILSGAVVLVVTLANLYFPELVINPLLAKNLIYFFGHVFINATIYMSVIAVYELLPVYAGRPWKVSRPFYAAWAAATVFVMAVYPHHLLLDAVMPAPLLVLGQIVSYLSGIPVLLVTAYGALLLVYRSGIQWQVPALWLMLAMFGWAGGVIPAIVDGTIQINKVMHNTMWVPGHFHFYLLIGLLPMVIGFGLHITSAHKALNVQLQRTFFFLYFAGAVAFSVAFLAGGWASVPRRWAQHWPEWMAYDQVGSLAAMVVIVAMVGVVIALVRRLLERNHGTTA